MQGKSCTRIPSPHGRTARSREPHSAGRKRGLGSPSAAVGGERREARARAVCRFPRRSSSNPELSLLGFSQLHHRIPLLSTGGERAAGDSRRGDGRSGRERGSTPLPRRNPAAVRGLMRPPLLMVVVVVVSTAHRGTLMRFSLCRRLMLELLQVAKAQPCVLRRFTPASRRKCVAARSHGRQELRAGQYQLDDDEPLWLAVVRDITWGLRSFLAFLAEQPRQLKHLEWPGFRNTRVSVHFNWMENRTRRIWTLSVIGDEAIGSPVFIFLQVTDPQPKPLPVSFT
uniref:Uncharacterized protein n=1 Tax=Oryza barthii TaxID=65489 RepID=A0A0D3H7J4_9ORYZ